MIVKCKLKKINKKIKKEWERQHTIDITKCMPQIAPVFEKPKLKEILDTLPGDTIYWENIK